MEPDPARAGAERASGRHYTCTITNVALRLLREDGGEATVATVLERAGSARSVPYLEDIENWISVDELCELLEAAVAQTGDERFARRVGEEALRQHSGTQVATALRSLGSPEAVLNAVALATPKFSTTTELEALETRSGHAVIRAVAREGFPAPRCNATTRPGCSRRQPFCSVCRWRRWRSPNARRAAASSVCTRSPGTPSWPNARSTPSSA